MKLKLTDLIGMKATSKDGHGGRKGVFTRVTTEDFLGEVVWVQWNGGNEEPYKPNSIYKVGESTRIGIYYSGEMAEPEPEPEIDLASLEPTIMQ